MSKKTTKPTIKEPKAPLTVSKALGGLGGIVMAFVVASISYSTYVVYFGTTGIVPKALLIPQAVFATVLVIYKFAK